jgi:hypothetical protein
MSPSARSAANGGATPRRRATPRSPSLHTAPGLGSYLSEVDRFALDMRKRFNPVCVPIPNFSACVTATGTGGMRRPSR